MLGEDDGLIGMSAEKMAAPEESRCEFCGEHRAGIRSREGPWLYGPCHMCSAKRERRERIATALLQGVLTEGGMSQRDSVIYAIECTDRLIAALDAKGT